MDDRKSFLARLVSISRYYFIVSLPSFAFLSKRNGDDPCNSADYAGFIFFFQPFKFRRVCGVCSGEL